MTKGPQPISYRGYHSYRRMEKGITKVKTKEEGEPADLANTGHVLASNHFREPGIANGNPLKRRAEPLLASAPLRNTCM